MLINTQNKPTSSVKFGSLEYVNNDLKEAAKQAVNIYKHYKPNGSGGVEILNDGFCITTDNLLMSIKTVPPMKNVPGSMYKIDYCGDIHTNNEGRRFYSKNLKLIVNEDGDVFSNGKYTERDYSRILGNPGELLPESRSSFIKNIKNLVSVLKEEWQRDISKFYL